MFETLQLNATQWYAAGLTLALAWLTVMLRPGLQRLLSLLLQPRAPAWIEGGTLLAQTIFLSAGLGLIVGWLGASTVVAVCAVLVLCLLVASLRSGRGGATWRSLRTRLKPTPQPTPAQLSLSLASDKHVSFPKPVLATSEPAVVTIPAEPTTALAITALPATPVLEPAAVLTPPVSIASAPAATVVPQRMPLRPAAALTRRPVLGKKTTTGLL